MKMPPDPESVELVMNALKALGIKEVDTDGDEDEFYFFFTLDKNCKIDWLSYYDDDYLEENNIREDFYLLKWDENTPENKHIPGVIVHEVIRDRVLNEVYITVLLQL